MAYLYLAIAIIAEVTATSALKASAEFSKPIPSMIVVVGFLVALYFMMLTIRTIPVGITYAIWSGLGIVLVGVVAFVLYKEIPDTPAMIGMGLIILGVVVINVFSNNINHEQDRSTKNHTAAHKSK